MLDADVDSCTSIKLDWENNTGLAEMVTRCRRHLLLWPEDPGVCLVLGDVLSQLGRYSEALQLLRVALSGFGTDCHLPLKLIGDHYRRGHAYRKAARYYQLAAAERPSDTSFYELRALCFFNLGALEAAEQVLLDGKILAGVANPMLTYQLGCVYRAQSRYPEAAQCFTECIAISPDFIDAEEAATDLQAAIDTQPPPPSQEQMIPEYIAVTGPLHEYRRLEICVQLFPTSFALWLEYGGTCVLLRRYSEALRAYRAARRIQSTDSCLVYASLGHLHRQRGTWHHANSYYEKCCELEPQDAAWHILRGGALATQGRLVDAESAHRQAIAATCGPKDEAYLNLGLVLSAQERFVEAVDAYRAAIANSPNGEYTDAETALMDTQRAIALLVSVQ